MGNAQRVTHMRRMRPQYSFSDRQFCNHVPSENYICNIHDPNRRKASTGVSMHHLTISIPRCDRECALVQDPIKDLVGKTGSSLVLGFIKPNCFEAPELNRMLSPRPGCVSWNGSEKLSDTFLPTILLQAGKQALHQRLWRL